MRQKVAVVPGMSGTWFSGSLENAVRQAGGEPIVTRTIEAVRRAAAQGMPIVSYSTGSAIADVALGHRRGATHVQIAPFGGRSTATEVVTGAHDCISQPRCGDSVARGRGHFNVVNSDEARNAIGRAIHRRSGV